MEIKEIEEYISNPNDQINYKQPSKYRIVYYYKHITKEMEYLIDEISKIDREKNEVIIVTEKNELNKLRLYAKISKPFVIVGNELRGEKYNLFMQIDEEKYDIILSYHRLYIIGGIETFIYNFCLFFKDKYKIAVKANKTYQNQIDRLENIGIKVLEKNKIYKAKICISMAIDYTSLFNTTIIYDKLITMYHDGINKPRVPDKSDKIIFINQKFINSFLKNNYCSEENSSLIYNLYKYKEPKKILKLISATRMSPEKGIDRMLKLIKILKENNIPFIWNIYSDGRMEEEFEEVIYRKPKLDIINEIADADYLVQLSDDEGYGYSLVEALSVGTPLLVTPISPLSDIQVEDGKNAFVLPYDMQNIDIDKIYNTKLEFNYNLDEINNKACDQWVQVIKEIGEF